MGPILFKLGFIPAFRPLLDHSLTEDMILCPIRTLRYYLDKLEILGEIGAIHLFQRWLFRRYTRSCHVNRQTVLLAYQRSDLETWNVSMAKAQDAPYMAASLSIKRGVFLYHIWKSHSIVLNYTLSGGLEATDGSDYS